MTNFDITTEMLNETVRTLAMQKQERILEEVAETDWSETEVLDVYFVMQNGGYEMGYNVVVRRHPDRAPESPLTFTHRPYEHYRMTEDELRESGVDPETGQYEDLDWE